MLHNLSLQLTLVSMLLFLVIAFSLTYFYVIQRLKTSKHHMEKQRLLMELQHNELSVRIEERELMMTQVSKEVHDNIGQIAHLSRMHLHEIETSATDEYQLKLIKYVSELADLMIYNTDHISHSLNSDFIKERGLVRVLEDDLEQIRSFSNIACYLHVDGKNNFLDAEQKLVIYRIAQEAIRNTLKHADASLLEVTLRYTDTDFTMNIHDDGKGFDFEKVKATGTLGLKNMSQRAKLLNTKLTINSSSAKGTVVTLQIGRL